MIQRRTYAGIPEEYSQYAEAAVVLLPVPYDETSTWGKGADGGPSAFLEASDNMELYDLESDTEVYKHGIWLADALTCPASPAEMVATVKNATAGYLADNKLFTMIGGEHSISIGAIMAANERFDKLSVLQLDAHSDLRPEYDGTPFSHACAMHQAAKNTNLVQVGIRSMDISEKPFVNKANVFYANDIACRNNWQQAVVDRLTNTVYLSIDLDYFDPAIVPATGTPEPGGMAWYPTLTLLQKVAQQRHIIGFDICELAPIKGQRCSEFLAAKLYFKILTYIFENKNLYHG